MGLAGRERKEPHSCSAKTTYRALLLISSSRLSVSQLLWAKDGPGKERRGRKSLFLKIEGRQEVNKKFFV